MKMAAYTPKYVGQEFVRQYYTTLHKDPTQLHRFYMKQSLFTHGSLQNDTPIKPIVGQEAIHAKIMQLDYRECYSKINSVDSQNTLNDGVVVQVAGTLTTRGLPSRKFTQTFVLEAEAPQRYYVFNDIFRYQDEEVENEEQAEENTAESYSAVDEDIKDEAVTVEYDQKVEAQAIDKNTEMVEDVNYHQAEHEIPSALTNGSSLLDEEESNDENDNAITQDQGVADAQPQEEEIEEQEALPYEDAAAEEEKHDEDVTETEEEEVVPQEPAEPEGPPKPVTWATFVKNTTPATPLQQANAPVARPVVAKVSPQPVVVPARPPKRREELPRRENRDDSRRKFVGAAPDSHQIFIGNLPANITEADVKSIFREYGTIVEVRLNPKNFGFVAFDTPEPAERILKREKAIMFGKSTINVEEKRASASAASRGGPRREFGRVRNDSGGRGNMPGGRSGPPPGNRDRPRGGGPGGQQKPRGAMNGGEGRGENSRGPRNRDRGGPVGERR